MSNYILDSEKKIKDKLEMLQSLEDIKVYISLISEKNQSLNQIKSNYLKLSNDWYYLFGTEIRPVSRDS